MVTAALEPNVADPHAAEVMSGRGRGLRLLRFGLRNLRRRPEYTVLSVTGIALVIAVVIIVQSIATNFDAAGTQAFADDVGKAPVWVVPPQGVTYNPALGALLANGAAPSLQGLPRSWTVRKTLGGIWTYRGKHVALYGVSMPTQGVAVVSQRAAESLGLADGSAISVGHRRLTVSVRGKSGTYIRVPAGVAHPVIGNRGWLSIIPPAGTSGVSAALSRVPGLMVTTEPARRADGRHPLAYITSGGGLFTFQARFSAALGGRVSGSLLGIISKLALVLGFIIAVTSFLAAVYERRREFGILASIGLSDEVLYFFLMEALIIFAAAYLVGAAIGIALLVIVLPGQVSISSVLQACALTLTYLPALGIFAALIPTHRIVQQRPADLLRAE
jgi:putative ABC transport system permease protein